MNVVQNECLVRGEVKEIGDGEKGGRRWGKVEEEKK